MERGARTSWLARKEERFEKRRLAPSYRKKLYTVEMNRFRSPEMPLRKER
jgi:hypothetical protein